MWFIRVGFFDFASVPSPRTGQRPRSELREMAASVGVSKKTARRRRPSSRQAATVGDVLTNVFRADASSVAAARDVWFDGVFLAQCGGDPPSPAEKAGRLVVPPRTSHARHSGLRRPPRQRQAYTTTTVWAKLHRLLNTVRARARLNHVPTTPHHRRLSPGLRPDSSRAPLRRRDDQTRRARRLPTSIQYLAGIHRIGVHRVAAHEQKSTRFPIQGPPARANVLPLASPSPWRPRRRCQYHKRDGNPARRGARDGARRLLGLSGLRHGRARAQTRSDLVFPAAR